MRFYKNDDGDDHDEIFGHFDDDKDDIDVFEWMDAEYTRQEINLKIMKNVIKICENSTNWKDLSTSLKIEQIKEVYKNLSLLIREDDDVVEEKEE